MTTKGVTEGRSVPRVCVIGAGSSGITACQNLAERGVEFACFEKGSAIGGNWRYMNDNGMSSAYRTLHINTSREMMQYEAIPMPADYPVYPGHAEIAAYFDRSDKAVARAGDRNGHAAAADRKLEVIREALAIIAEEKPTQERTVALLELFATV